MDNKVEFLGHYGSDKIIALSAWTSTSRDLDEEKEARIPALIEKLWQAGHETPFEKGLVHFLITSDIATHIHFLKHRISSLNAESARYKELREDKYYVPDDWVGVKISEITRDTFAKLSVLHILDGPHANTDWAYVLHQFNNLSNHLYHLALQDLQDVVGRKRAKESSRFFKPYASQITYDVQFNMRSFANFLKLRDSEHAQVEVRNIAHEMAKAVLAIEGNPFEHTMKQFGYGHT